MKINIMRFIKMILITFNTQLHFEPLGIYPKTCFL